MDNKFTRVSAVLASICLTLTVVMSCAPARAGQKSIPKVSEELTPEKLATLDNRKILYTYDSLGRKDPFRPFVDFSQIERSIPTEAGRPLTPLEKYALNQFRLVGIILAGDMHNYALVEDPESIGHTVHEGDRIGNASGYVKEIKLNEVLIEEPYLDIFDKQQTRIITLRLRDIDEETILHLEHDE
jgi:type IV pilus assembly protein PilP